MVRSNMCQKASQFILAEASVANAASNSSSIIRFFILSHHLSFVQAVAGDEIQIFVKGHWSVKVGVEDDAGDFYRIG